MSLLKGLAKIGLIIPTKAGNLITAGLEKVTGKQYGRTTTEDLAKTKTGKALGLGIVATAGALAVTTGAAGKLTAAVGKSFVSKPIQTTTGVLIGAPLVAGVISEKPELLTELPQKSFSAGTGLVETITEHPVASAVVGSVAGGVGAYEVGKKYFGDEKEKAIETDTGQTTPSTPSFPGETLPQEVKAVTQEKPITAETTTIETGKRKRRKTQLKAPSQTISQRVNVNVVSNSSANRITKKYLNEVLV